MTDPSSDTVLTPEAINHRRHGGTCCHDRDNTSFFRHCSTGLRKPDVGIVPGRENGGIGIYYFRWPEKNSHRGYFFPRIEKVRKTVRTTPNNREYYYKLTVDPLIEADGVIKGIACTAVNIIVHNQTELALRNSERRLQLVLEGGQMAMWEWDIVNDLRYGTAGILSS